MKANLSVILNALGMGMAVSAVVLLLLDAITVQDVAMLLGIGLFCVALDGLRRARPAEVPPVRKPAPSGKPPAGNKRRK